MLLVVGGPMPFLFVSTREFTYVGRVWATCPSAVVSETTLSREIGGELGGIGPASSCGRGFGALFTATDPVPDPAVARFELEALLCASRSGAEKITSRRFER